MGEHRYGQACSSEDGRRHHRRICAWFIHDFRVAASDLRPVPALHRPLPAFADDQTPLEAGSRRSYGPHALCGQFDL